MRGTGQRGTAAKRYLLVPAGGGGEGVGHLARCLRLAGQLQRSGRPRVRVAFLTSRMDAASREHLRRSLGGRAEMLPDLRGDGGWDLIVLDGRATNPSDLSRLQEHGPVVCLDEGGPARKHASFLIDSIPRLSGSNPANLSSLSFLELPRRSRRAVRWPPHAVLVSFGGEDREDLSGRLLSVLLEAGLFSPSQLTVVEGPLFERRQWPRGVSVVRGVDRLADLLPAYDVVFTHFGVTALEALACGVPAILLNPGAYHQRLGRASGIPCIGIRTPRMETLRRFLADGEAIRRFVDRFNEKVRPRANGLLAGSLRSMRPQGSPRCPVCGRDGNRVLARFPDRTYRLCAGCGLMYLESFADRAMMYGSRYFSAEYKAHYGRTYLQDFEAIKSASRERLGILRAVAGEDLDGVIIDVGCAYGPFLSAVRDVGLPCFGIDVSEHAVAYVRKKLGVPALCAPFEEVQKRHLPRRIAAITLWYVIEHFQDVRRVLRKAAALLPAGGVMAFSTPNGKGISARKNLRRFLQESPPDHFTVFSPAGLAALLDSSGFQLRRIRVTGHHPERFPGLAGTLAARSRVAARLLHAASVVLRLGDTFEAYAVKVEST